MGYTEDTMNSLKYAIRDFNKNIDVIKRLTLAIEKQNELKEKELELELQKQELYFQSKNTSKRY